MVYYIKPRTNTLYTSYNNLIDVPILKICSPGNGVDDTYTLSVNLVWQKI